jgi:acyl carrier protein
LAEIWKQLLNLQQVGRHDNFFRLGGHSLLITRLVNRVNQRFSLQLQLKDVMDINTLAQQAGYIDMQLSALTVPRQDSEERESFEL